MKQVHVLQIEVKAKWKLSFILDMFKSMGFISKVKVIESTNEITNPQILQSIEEYETGKTQPTPLNLTELKAMMNA